METDGTPSSTRGPVQVDWELGYENGFATITHDGGDIVEESRLSIRFEDGTVLEWSQLPKEEEYDESAFAAGETVFIEIPDGAFYSWLDDKETANIVFRTDSGERETVAELDLEQLIGPFQEDDSTSTSTASQDTETETATPTQTTSEPGSCDPVDIDEFPVGQTVTITTVVEDKVRENNYLQSDLRLQMDFDYGTVYVLESDEADFEQVSVGDCITIEGEWAQDYQSGDYFIEDAEIVSLTN